MQLKYKSDYITLKLNVINGKNKWINAQDRKDQQNRKSNPYGYLDKPVF